jgi:ribosomal protein S18 acetylase RimI-like enzyme
VSTRIVTIDRRPAESRDDELLRELFAESRPDFDLIPREMRSSILDLQVRAQRSQYAATYPDATDEVLVADGLDVGRLVLDRGRDAVRIVDIAVRSSHRGEGIASSVLRDVIDDADRLGVPACLSVWAANIGARRLYERLGFTVVDDSDGYLEMQRRAATEGD